MKLLLRADASPQMGAGHLMRCLALSEAWHDWGGEVVLATHADGILSERLSEEGRSVIRIDGEPGGEDDARRTAEIAQREAASWVVLDGYHFNDEYERRICGSGAPIAAFDDYGHAQHMNADLVVNPNAYADEAEYQARGTSCELLLGSRYVVLRREFRSYRDWFRRVRTETSRILVGVGGFDRENRTQEILEAVAGLSGERVHVIVLIGSNNPHGSALETAGKAVSGRVEFRRDVREVAPLMAWADVAVGACGISTWERAFMGLPTVALVLDPNQRRVSDSVDELGLGVLFPRRSGAPKSLTQILRDLLRDHSTQAAMALQGRSCVDGEGSDRLVQRLSGERLRLRKVLPKDRELILEWANEEQSRAASFSDELIPWDQHVEWFSKKLVDPSCHFFIGVAMDETPVGQVRLDVTGNGAVLSVSVDKRQRGKHLGSDLIAAATDRILENGIANEVQARIKPHNTASIRAFVRAGFERVGEEDRKDESVVHYCKKRTA